MMSIVQDRPNIDTLTNTDNLDEPAAQPRKKIALISTYGELCGIAAYSFFVKRQLEQKADVQVFSLDQFFLRSESSAVRKLGDREIKRICKELKKFDSVSLQLEFGTLGTTHADILRRFKWLLRAAPKIAVTFHTPPEIKDVSLIKSILEHRKYGLVQGIVMGVRNYNNLIKVAKFERGILSAIRKCGNKASVIMHNKRDARAVRYAGQIPNVYHHPLAFLQEHDIQNIYEKATKEEFSNIKSVPESAKLIGVFGFLTEYKNILMVLRAMQFLPEDYHLLVFGGVHPNEIKKFQGIDPYLNKVLGEGQMGKSLKELMTVSSESDPEKVGDVKLDFKDIEAYTDYFTPKKGKLWDRVHFMGSLDDPEFLKGMSLCDIVVLPYMEVGQGSSGPISQAVELGKRVLASRNKCFMQFERYFRDRIEFFDLGNVSQLTELILSDSKYDVENYKRKYNTNTNMDIYLSALLSDHQELREAEAENTELEPEFIL